MLKFIVSRKTALRLCPHTSFLEDVLLGGAASASSHTLNQLLVKINNIDSFQIVLNFIFIDMHLS